MTEESTTPTWLSLSAERQLGAVNVGDLDAALRLFAPDCVWELELGTLEGVAAIRAFLEEWLGSYGALATFGLPPLQTTLFDLWSLVDRISWFFRSVEQLLVLGR